MPFDCGIRLIYRCYKTSAINHNVCLCAYRCGINEIFDLMVRCMSHLYAQKVLQIL